MNSFCILENTQNKKILIIDPLAHFGGHASRNEFNSEARIGYGGSESFQSPKEKFYKVVHELFKELGIELKKFEENYFDHKFSGALSEPYVYHFQMEILLWRVCSFVY